MIHGGLGDGSFSLEDIAAVKRPLKEAWDHPVAFQASGGPGLFGP